MSIKDDALYKQISERAEWFRSEASSHKFLNRALWGAASLISVMLALSANFDFTIFDITSNAVTKFLSIILPVITGYTIMRSPEALWVLEVDIRNRLKDLAKRMELNHERVASFDREAFEKEYFLIMGEANNKWREIKQSQGKT